MISKDFDYQLMLARSRVSFVESRISWSKCDVACDSMCFFRSLWIERWRASRSMLMSENCLFRISKAIASFLTSLFRWWMSLEILRSLLELSLVLSSFSEASLIVRRLIETRSRRTISFFFRRMITIKTSILTYRGFGCVVIWLFN